MAVSRCWARRLAGQVVGLCRNFREERTTVGQRRGDRVLMLEDDSDDSSLPSSDAHCQLACRHVVPHRIPCVPMSHAVLCRRPSRYADPASFCRCWRLTFVLVPLLPPLLSLCLACWCSLLLTAAPSPIRVDGCHAECSACVVDDLSHSSASCVGSTHLVCHRPHVAWVGRTPLSVRELSGFFLGGGRKRRVWRGLRGSCRPIMRGDDR